MNRRFSALLLLGLFSATSVLAATKPKRPVAAKTRDASCRVSCTPEWPNSSPRRVSEIGRGVAIVFSPDLAPRGNRAFYERLGFMYLEDANWANALRAVHQRNRMQPHRRIDTIVLETHGTNGHGLKLQENRSPYAARSYISIGALQETLGDAGVRTAFVSACNAGRLFRPEIYKELDREPEDCLFLPPTIGIIDASPGFDPKRSRVVLLRRKTSHLETLVHGHSGELPSGVLQTSWLTRKLPFAVSTLLMQLVMGDRTLAVRSGGYETALSKNDFTPEESEKVFLRFVYYLGGVMQREKPPVLQTRR